VTGGATFGFHRKVFVDKGPLLVSMTFNAGCVGAGSKSRLFQFKTTMRVMAIATLHRTFKNLVMVRQIKLVFDLRVAAQTKLRVTALQHF
jgi:hypothetical protein